MTLHDSTRLYTTSWWRQCSALSRTQRCLLDTSTREAHGTKVVPSYPRPFPPNPSPPLNTYRETSAKEMAQPSRPSRIHTSTQSSTTACTVVSRTKMKTTPKTENSDDSGPWRRIFCKHRFLGDMEDMPSSCASYHIVVHQSHSSLRRSSFPPTTTTSLAYSCPPLLERATLKPVAPL